MDATREQLEQLVALSSTKESAEHQELGQYTTSLAKASASVAQSHKLLTEIKARNCSHQETISDLKAQVSKREQHLQTVEFETDHAIDQVTSLESRLRSDKLKLDDSLLFEKQQLEASKSQVASRTRFLKGKINEHVTQISTLQDQIEAFSNQLERLRMEDSSLTSRCDDLQKDGATEKESTDGHNGGRVKQLVEQIETCQAELRLMNERIERAQQQRISAEAALCLASQERRNLEISLENRFAAESMRTHSSHHLKESLLQSQAELGKVLQQLERKESEKRSLLAVKSRVEVELHTEVGRAKDLEREVLVHNSRLREGLKRERRRLDANNHEASLL